MTRPFKFDLTKPCDNCPFKHDHRFGLRVGRMRKIIHDLTVENTTFECHKTVNKPVGQQCAGAMIFLIKSGEIWANMLYRLAAWGKMFDPDQYDLDQPVSGDAEEVISNAEF